jgi:tripeptidyl-peptidase I
MLWISFLAGALGLVQLGLSTPVKRWDDFIEKHAWEEIPRGWELWGPAPEDHPLELRIGLKQNRFDELISNLYEVSDSTHERCV